jgi:P-type Cu+ transporter
VPLFWKYLSGPDAIVLDKTGTITSTDENIVTYEGVGLNTEIKSIIKAMTGRSSHPLSKMLNKHLIGVEESEKPDSYEEFPGQGLEAISGSYRIRLGSAAFTGATKIAPGTGVHIAVNGQYTGVYHIGQSYRKGIENMLMKTGHMTETWIISGDNASEKETLEKMTAYNTRLLFNQMPEDKLQKIAELQSQGKKVIMAGDGLNDAGALRQSDLGIAVTASLNNFTPASDAILRADNLFQLDRFIRMAKTGRRIIAFCFGYSIIYNVLGIYFAVSGMLTPLMAAIIMPASSLTIILFSWLAVSYYASSIFKK